MHTIPSIVSKIIPLRKEHSCKAACLYVKGDVGKQIAFLRGQRRLAVFPFQRAGTPNAAFGKALAERRK